MGGGKDRGGFERHRRGMFVEKRRNKKPEVRQDRHGIEGKSDYQSIRINFHAAPMGLENVFVALWYTTTMSALRA